MSRSGFLHFFSLVLLSFPAHALNVSGPITVDTTWLAANSPYVVTANVLVDSTATLTIEPGVEVRLDPGLSIQINGQLIARGTETDSILFTANQSDTHWGYLLFEDGSTSASYGVDGSYVSGSVLEYVVVEYGGGADVTLYNAAVRIRDSGPYINRSIVRYSADSGIYSNDGDGSRLLKLENSEVYGNYGTGLTAYTSLVEVRDSRFSDNGQTGAIVVGSFTVTGNTIENNGHEPQCYDHSTCRNEATGLYLRTTDASTVTNNTIQGNASQSPALHAEGTSGNLTISHNIVAGNLGGAMHVREVAAVESNLVVRNVVLPAGTSGNGALHISEQYSNQATSVQANIIADNQVDDSALDAAGVFLGGSDDGFDFSGNVVAGNEAAYWSGVYVDTSTSSTLSNNTLADNTSRLLGADGAVTGTVFNRKYSSRVQYLNNNIFRNSGQYEFFNDVADTSADVTASDNWWGSATEAGVQETIYDYFDDATKSIVLYAPHLTAINTSAPISPPTGLSVTPGVGTIDLAWTANPESDLAGYKVYWGTEDAPFYENVVDVGNIAAYTISGLDEGAWFVGVTAYDTTYDPAADVASTLTNDNMTAGNESWFSRGVANPMKVSAVSHDFGDVYTGTSVQQTLTVSNLGYSNITLNAVTVSGTDAAEFAIGADGCTGTTIAAGESCTFAVILSPTTAGAKSASVAISGGENLEVTFTGSAVATGDIELTSASHDFGALVLGTSDTAAIAIGNVGTTTLYISAATLAGTDSADFRLVNSCTSVSASQSCSLNVVFTPTSAGMKSATLTIDSDDPDEPRVVVTLGGAAVTPVAIDYVGVDAATGLAPLASQFTVTATGGSGSYSYNWDFGDGSTSTAHIPSHTFSTAGTYTVVVVVSDADDAGNRSSSQLAVVVVDEPAAYSPLGLDSLFADVSSGIAPLDTGFTVTPSGGSGNYTYAWDFGDGTTSTAQAPKHTFTIAGTYAVRVSVTDAEDGANTAIGQLAIVVVDAPTPYSPVGISGLSASISSGVAPLDAGFAVIPSGGSGNYTYEWDFGDGTTSAAQAPNHTFTAVGTYAVQVTVTDAENGANIATGQLAIVVVEVAAAYSPVVISGLAATRVVGVAPLSVDFELTPSGGSGAYNYEWDFGDGTATETTRAPSHVFTTPGTYTVTVTLIDRDNPANASTGGLTVIVTEAPVAYEPVFIDSLVASQVAGTAPVAVELTVTAAGGSGNYIYDWNFGDGNTATLANPMHTFTAAGIYPVTVTVTDLQDDKNVASGNLSILVVEEPVNLGVAVEVSSPSGAAPHPVTLTATMVNGSAPYTVTWDFGDGNTQTQTTSTDTAQVSHTYQAAGSYEIGVTVVADGAVGAEKVTVQALTAVSVEAVSDDGNETDDRSGGEGSQSSGGGGGSGPLLLFGLLLLFTVARWARRRS